MVKEHAACPICGDKTLKQAAPFCSQRCKDVDLNRWLNGSYAIPSQDQTVTSDPVNDNERSK